MPLHCFFANSVVASLAYSAIKYKESQDQARKKAQAAATAAGGTQA